MNTLKKIKCEFDPQTHRLIFRWEADKLNTDPYIYIVGLSKKEGRITPDSQLRLEKNLDHVVGSILKYTSTLYWQEPLSEVYLKRFFVCSDREKWEDDQPLLDVLSRGTEDCPYLFSVMLGKAVIRAQVKMKRADSPVPANSVSFTLRSTEPIRKNVLGYRYQCCGKGIELPIPFALPGGNRPLKTPSVLIPVDSGIEIVVYGEKNPAGISIQMESR